jgi:hypothetical protein
LLLKTTPQYQACSTNIQQNRPIRGSINLIQS